MVESTADDNVEIPLDEEESKGGKNENYEAENDLAMYQQDAK